MEIRKATKKDIPKILKLSGEFIEEYRRLTRLKTNVSVETALRYKRKIFEKDLAPGRGTIFIAEDNKKFIGYIFVLTFMPGMEDTKRHAPGYISDLHITKDFRKKGIAKKLYREAEKWLKSKKKKEIILDVGKYNKSAINLYKKVGFKEKDIKMQKKLK